MARRTLYLSWLPCTLFMTSCFGGTTALVPSTPRSIGDDSSRVVVERVIVDSSSVRFELVAEDPKRYRSARLNTLQIDDCEQGLLGELAQGGGSVIVDFPLAAASPLLEKPSKLVLLTDGGEAGCISVPVEPSEGSPAFTPASWGLGWAGRLRPAGLPDAHFGSSIALEVGVDHWFTHTLVRLGFEVAVAGCGDVSPASERCDGQQFIGLGLDAAPPIVETTSLKLALALGYGGRQVLTTEQADTPTVNPVLVHGPRARLFILPGTWGADWMGNVSQNRFMGIDFGVELLQREWLRDISVVPSFGWVGSYAF